MEENNKLFREKSLEQLSTPDQLTGYLRVTGPGVWILLSGVIILLGGMLVWGLFGTIHATINAPVKVTEGQALCYILNNDLNSEEGSVTIKIGDVDMQADIKDADRVILDASADPALYASGYLSSGKLVSVLHADTNLMDGVYDAEVVTEAVRPLSLLLGND